MSNIWRQYIWGSQVNTSAANDTTTNSTFYPIFYDGSNPNIVRYANSKLTFNPSTGTFSSVIFNTLSDARYKKDIHPIQNALEIVDQLEGVKFTWIESNQPDLGFIAQQVEKVLPEVVHTDEDNGFKGVSYQAIIPVLTQAIKELVERITILENKI